MADKNFQMKQRSADNSGWDNLYPNSKAANISIADAGNKITGTNVETALQELVGKIGETLIPMYYYDSSNTTSTKVADTSCITGQACQAKVTATETNLMSFTISSAKHLNYNISLRCKCSNLVATDSLKIKVGSTVIGTLKGSDFTTANTWVYRNFVYNHTGTTMTVSVVTATTNNGVTVSVENCTVSPVTLSALV